MNQITISQIFHAVWRHKIKVLLVFLAVLSLAISAFVVWPRKYGSEGRLFVQLGRNNSGLDPTSGNKSVSIQDTRETEIRTVAEIAKSRGVIEQVVDDVGAEKILKDSSLSKYISIPSVSNFFGSKDGAGVSEDGLSKEDYQRLRKREEAAKKLQKNLTVTTEKKTSVISIYATTTSPRLAQQLVDSLMRHTQEKHLEVHSLSGSSEFFDVEYEKHSKLVDQAIKEQSQFRSGLGILSIDGARSSLQNIIERLENELISSEVEYSQAAERVRKYETELAGIENTVEVPTGGVERKSFEDARTEIMRMKTQRASLSATLSDQNPKVRQLDEAIRNAEAAISEMVGDRTESQVQVNPVFETVRTSLVQSRVDRDAASSRLKNVREKLAEANMKLENLNSALLQADQHQRNVEIAKQYLANYATKRGEAKVLDDLDRQQISDVVIAQEANLILKHVSPRGSLFVLMGVVVAALCSFSTALYFDRNNLSATVGEEEVEQVLDLPVLVTLPRVYSSRNMVN